MRKQLKKSEQRELCSRWTAPNGKKLKLCVDGRKYGFAGWLYGTDGSRLPVGTGKARTVKTAMRNARRFLRKVRAKSTR